jgi:hypothetical protein
MRLLNTRRMAWILISLELNTKALWNVGLPECPLFTDLSVAHGASVLASQVHRKIVPAQPPLLSQLNRPGNPAGDVIECCTLHSSPASCWAAHFLWTEIDWLPLLLMEWKFSLALWLM